MYFIGDYDLLYLVKLLENKSAADPGVKSDRIM